MAARTPKSKTSPSASRGRAHDAKQVLDEANMERVITVIRHMRLSGFTLQEIVAFLAEHDIVGPKGKPLNLTAVFRMARAGESPQAPPLGQGLEKALATRSPARRKRGTVAWGQRLSKGGARVEDPDEAHVTLLIFELRDKGLTMQAIADTLAKRRIFTRSGKPFVKQRIHQILQKPDPRRSSS